MIRRQYPLIEKLLISSLEGLVQYPVLKSIVEARNTVSNEEIDQYVGSLRTGEERIDQWLGANLRKYLIRDHDEAVQIKNINDVQNPPAWLEKALESGQPVYRVEIKKPFQDKIQHVLDFLKSEDSPRRLDALTVPEAIKQSQKWTEELQKKKVDEQEVTEGEEVLKKYPDGYSWKKLTNKDALLKEGEEMGHCVGGYADRVASGRTQIYSLRDSSNDPHCTIEITDGQLAQIKGKSNAPVVPKYHPYVIDFVNNEDSLFDDVNHSELQNAGMMYLNGKVYTLEGLKKDPEMVQELTKDFCKDHKPLTIQTNDAGVVISLYLEDAINFIYEKSDLPRDIRDKYIDILEDFYDVDYRTTEEGYNIQDVLNEVGKTKKELLEKFKAEVDAVAEQNEDEYRDLGEYVAKNIYSLSDNAQEAIGQALNYGYQAGTQKNATRYVYALLESLVIHKGQVLDASQGKVEIQIDWEALMDDHMGYVEIPRSRDGFDYEFDEKAGAEGFIETYS